MLPVPLRRWLRPRLARLTGRAAAVRLDGELRALVDQAFDRAFYLGRNPDVATAGLDPLEHFLAYGWREGRDPSSGFSVSDYGELYPDVVEAGVCPVADPKTGHAIVAFVVLKDSDATSSRRLAFTDSPELASSRGDPGPITSLARSSLARCAATEDIASGLKAHVAKAIGPIAKPRDVVVVPDVPKTRSGKIMRRLLTQLFEGTELGDTTSLQNEPSIADIQDVLRTRNSQK